MKVDDFLADYFRDHEDVIIRATQLQRLLQKLEEIKKNNQALEKENLKLKDKVAGLETKIELLEIEKPMRVDVLI